MPAVALSDVALNEVKTILTNFYVNPNTGTYTAVKEVYTLYNKTRIETGNPVLENARVSYGAMLGSLNTELVQKVYSDARTQQNFTALSPDQQKRLATPNVRHQ
jgi:hypothetical protein